MIILPWTIKFFKKNWKKIIIVIVGLIVFYNFMIIGIRFYIWGYIPVKVVGEIETYETRDTAYGYVADTREGFLERLETWEESGCQIFFLLTAAISSNLVLGLRVDKISKTYATAMRILENAILLYFLKEEEKISLYTADKEAEQLIENNFFYYLFDVSLNEIRLIDIYHICSMNQAYYLSFTVCIFNTFLLKC